MEPPLSNYPFLIAMFAPLHTYFHVSSPPYRTLFPCHKTPPCLSYPSYPRGMPAPHPLKPDYESLTGEVYAASAPSLPYPIISSSPYPLIPLSPHPLIPPGLDSDSLTGEVYAASIPVHKVRPRPVNSARSFSVIVLIL